MLYCKSRVALSYSQFLICVSISSEFSRLNFVKIPVLLCSVFVESVQRSQKIIQLLLTGAFEWCGKRQQIYPSNIIKLNLELYKHLLHPIFHKETTFISLGHRRESYRLSFKYTYGCPAGCRSINNII